MMVSFKFLNNPIEFKDGFFPVLCVENKKLFRNLICSFEKDFSEEYFTFSKNFEPFEFCKHGVFISDPLNVNLESKKLISKVNSYIENAANTEYEEQLVRAKSDLLSLADSLCAFCDFDCEYNCDISAADIIKMLQFKIGKADNSPEELLMMYLSLVSKYLKTEVFVISNLHLFFDKDELELIYQTLTVNHIKLLSVECVSAENKLSCEEFYIVDNDLCEIDKEKI